MSELQRLVGGHLSRPRLRRTSVLSGTNQSSTTRALSAITRPSLPAPHRVSLLWQACMSRPHRPLDGCRSRFLCSWC